MSLFGEQSLDAARKARRDKIADIRVDDLDPREGGAFHREIVSAMLDAALAALDTAQLVEIAARSLAEPGTRARHDWPQWSDLSEGLRDHYRRQARTSLEAIGLLEEGEPDGPS